MHTGVYVLPSKGEAMKKIFVAALSLALLSGFVAQADECQMMCDDAPACREAKTTESFKASLCPEECAEFDALCKALDCAVAQTQENVKAICAEHCDIVKKLKDYMEQPQLVGTVYIEIA